jgi:inosine-uridine nucleoside N-ribohydrolase
MYRILLVLNLLLLCCIAQLTKLDSAHNALKKNEHVIIDTDLAFDDWMAILFMLKNPDYTVDAITISGTGEVHCDPGVQNATKLVALTGHDPIPVACGRETPLAGDHVFPDDWRDAVDSMLGLELPEGENPNIGKNSTELITSVLRSSSEKYLILTLGPLTNIADLFTSAPDTIGKIKRIYSMGGAIRVPGHLESSGIENHYAEWNIYIDPVAANIVFKSGASVTLVPLDVTNQVLVTPTFVKLLKASIKSAEAAFIYEVLDRIRDAIEAGTYYFWDPLTAVIMTNDDIVQIEKFHLCVNEEEGSTSGQILENASCPAIDAATHVDAKQAINRFVDTLNGVKL